MSIPAGTARSVVSGTLAGGEEFSFTVATKFVEAATQDTADRINGGVVAAVTNNLLTAAVRLLIPVTTVFTDVRTYLYTGGSTAAVQAAGILNVPGTGASSALPNQCCLVATLLTGVPGRRNRGRWYLPFGTAGILGEGQLSVANAGVIATAVADFCESLKVAGGTGGGIDSPVQVVSVVGTASRAVTAIKVDTRFDVHRSRAKQQAILGSSTKPVA